MTAPHVASDNTAIADAEAAKVANAERYLRECLETFVSRFPMRVHLDRLIAAAEQHRELRIDDLERRADAVRAIR